MTGKCAGPQPAAERGFTLTELAIVLGIIGLILGAIWTAASKVYANNRVTKAVNEILSVVGSVRATFGGKGAMYPMTSWYTAAGVNFGWFPPDMIQTAVTCFEGANPCPLSPYGTGMSVGNSTGFGAAPQGYANRFEVVIGNTAITGVSAKDCPALMAAVLQQAASTGLVYMESDNGGGVTVTTSSPAVTATQVTNCSGNVVFQFTL